MILSYLLLAHLLADFVFQPASLVQWKMKSKLGTLVHVLIHFVTNIIVLMPFILGGYSWLIGVSAGICFIHFWIDEAKINYDLRHDKKVKPFIIDQMLHLLTILLATFLLWDIHFKLPTENLFYQLYGNISVIIFLAFIVVVSTVIEVYKLQKIREKHKNAELRLSAEHMLTRIIVFTITYCFFMLISFVLAEMYS